MTNNLLDNLYYSSVFRVWMGFRLLMQEIIERDTYFEWYGISYKKSSYSVLM